MVFSTSLHNQDNQGRNGYDSGADSHERIADACRYTKKNAPAQSRKKASSRRGMALSLFVIAWVSVNSLVLFLEGVQC